jgi:PBSX family phage terminase large subunit
MSSTPTFQDFNPTLIQWQYDSICYAHNFDYTRGILESFASGSIGSAKTIKDIHQIVKHCIENDGAKYLMVRRALKDLKRTSWDVLLKHISDIPHLISSYNKSDMTITFINGSSIIGDSYDKGDLEKFRSLELSGADFEEGNECTKEVYEAIKMRVGRIPSVVQNIITIRTNPDEPSHWLYEYFIEDKKHPCKKVAYSLTEQNPFLPKWYIENLKADLDPMMARRMLKGEWLSIRGEAIYYAYDSDKQFLRDTEYKINPYHPIYFGHDQNIADGKPMSMCMWQYINGVFHVFNEFILQGFSTPKLMDEIGESGVFENHNLFIITGDCNGWNKDTRGNLTDYDHTRKYIESYVRKDGTYVDVQMEVPKSNPSVRARQNMVNAQCLNDLKQIRLYVYKDAPTVDKGLRLTKLKNGSTYLEDDNDPFQHVITGLGYGVYRIKKYLDNNSKSGIIFE